MKLYTHHASPNGRKVLITAAHLGVTLEIEIVDVMNAAHRSPAFLALNANAKIPVLQDDSFVLWESNAIMQYLASKKPGNSLFPDDARVRADITRWQCWELAHWFPALHPFLWENLFKSLLRLGSPDPAALAAAVEKYLPVASVLDRQLGNSQFLVGDALTLADISVSAYLMYLEPAQIPLAGLSNVRAWFERMQNIDAWKQTDVRMAP